MYWLIVPSPSFFLLAVYFMTWLLNFCVISVQVSSEENDGQLGSPKAIPVASMPLVDVHVDSAKTAKKDGLKANGSSKDRSGNSTSVSTQDSNMKIPISQTSGGTESDVSSQAKPSSKKPAVRKKVPFEKGYSQMDWLKLTQTHPDLAGKLVNFSGCCLMIFGSLIYLVISGWLDAAA